MAVIKTKTFHEAWDCDGCGTQGLSAYNCKQCPNCGAPLDSEGVYRTKRPVENYSFKGHDINCAHCETRNEKRFSCRNCGASLTDGDDARVEKFTYKSDTDTRPPPRTRTKPRASAQRPGVSTLSRVGSIKTINRKWGFAGAGIAMLAAIVGLWFYSQLHATIPVTLTADRAHWVYHLSLEDYEPRERSLTVEDGAFGSPPSDAYRVVSARVFVRSEPIYQSQTVSQTCTGTSSQSNGDGTWTQTTYTYDCSYTQQVHVGDRSIWGDQYNYLVDRWEPITPLTKEGWGKETDFPTFSTSKQCLSARPAYGCVRAPDEPRLTFIIHFFYVEDGEEERQDVTRTMSRDIWEDFRLGETYPAVLNGFGKIRAIQGIDSEYESLMSN